MAPERFRGQGDARADIYALGLTLYELLAGRPAFEKSDPSSLILQVTQEAPPRLRKLNRTVPIDLETIVHTAIAREPERRYATAQALAEDLQRFLDGRPSRARRVSVVERGWYWCRRNPIVAGLTAAVFALLVAVAAIASVGYLQTTLALRGEGQQRRAAEDCAGRGQARGRPGTGGRTRNAQAVVRGKHQPDAAGVGHGPVESPPGPAGGNRALSGPGFRVVLLAAPLPPGGAHADWPSRRRSSRSPGRRMEGSWRPQAWTAQPRFGKPPPAGNASHSEGPHEPR